MVAACDDSGLGHVYYVSEQDQSLSLAHTLQNKHSNICFKIRFDDEYPLLYTAAFDYKLIQWNLEDNKKSQSRNLFEVLSANLGAEALSYNPPFVYCLGLY